MSSLNSNSSPFWLKPLVLRFPLLFGLDCGGKAEFCWDFCGAVRKGCGSVVVGCNSVPLLLPELELLLLFAGGIAS